MKTCARVRIEAEAALIEGSSLPSHVSAHLGSCSSCRGEVAELQKLVKALGTLPVPKMPATLISTIEAAVLADLAKRQRPAPFYVRAMRPLMQAASAAGVAALIVIAAGTSLIVTAAVRTTLSTPAPTTATPAPSQPSTPSTPKPTVAPTDPAASEAPASAAPTPTPAPTDLPRRTPEPVSPTPSGDPSTAAPGSTSP